MPVEYNEFLKQLKEYDRDGWRSQANCRGVDPNLFFEEAMTNEDRAMAAKTRAQAKKFCEECLVKQECLRFAQENDIRYGIFGGLSYRNRLALKTGRKKK